MQASTPEVRSLEPQSQTPSRLHADRPWSLGGELSQMVLQLTWGAELLSSAYPESPQGPVLCLHTTLNSPRGG